MDNYDGQGMISNGYPRNFTDLTMTGFYIGEHFKLFPQLPPEIRFEIWDIVASQMIPYEGRIITIPCDDDMAAEARRIGHFYNWEPLPAPEAFLKTHGTQLMPRLQMKYYLSDFKTDRIDILDTDIESDGYLRHPMMHACRESRRELLRKLAYIQHPKIPESGFLMHPPSDILTVNCLTTAEQLRLIKKYYPQEQLNQIQAIIFDEMNLWERFIDETAKLLFHLSDVLDVFQGVKTIILYSLSAWWHLYDYKQHVEKARELRQRDGRKVAWLMGRGISVEYHDEEGTIHGFI